MIATAALLWVARDLDYPPEVVEHAARHSMLWLLPHMDARGQTGPDFSSIDATITLIRAVNPRAKIGMYVGGLSFKREIDPPAFWLTDADLLHRPDGSPLSWHDAVGAFSGGDAFTYCAPNLGSTAVQDTLLDGYVAFVQQHQLDGILIDGYDPNIYAAHVRTIPPSGMFGAATGCLEGPYHLAETWDPVLAQFGERLRWRLEQVGAQLLLNGLDVGHNIEIVERGSGVLNEGFWAAYAAPAGIVWDEPSRFADLIRQVQAVTARRRSIFLLASIGGYRLNDPTTTISDSPELQRYYLGTYLLIQEPPYSSLGYHPHIPYRAWDGWDMSGHPSGNPYIFWSDDWDLDYGYPLGEATAITSVHGAPTAVWGRQYSRCVVLVNPAATTQQAIVQGRYREWHPETGSVVDQSVQAPYYIINVPPKVARVLFKEAA